jgi:hypothetical protein
LWAALFVLAWTFPLQGKSQGQAFLDSLREPATPPGDFFQEWASARNHLEGRPVYENQEKTLPLYLNRTRDPGDRHFVEVNAHPPTAVLLVLPLARLEFHDAFLTWNLASLVMLAIAAGLVIGALGPRPSPWALLPAAALLLVCNPLRQQINQGQLNGVLLLLITGAWLADRSGRGWLAGALVAAATMIKLFPVSFSSISFCGGGGKPWWQGRRRWQSSAP